MLNPENPVTFGPLDLYDYYFEHKMQQHLAIQNAPPIIKEVHDQYAKISGRKYGNGIIEKYKAEDAEIIVIGLSSTMGTVKRLIDQERKKGTKIGAIRIRTFRPFPHQELVEALKDTKTVAVLDRSFSFGAQGGPLYLETKAALYETTRIPISDYIYGIGGRDAPPTLIQQIIERQKQILAKRQEKGEIKIVGVRE